MRGTCLGSLSSSEWCSCWWAVFTRQSGCCVISCFHHQSQPSHTPQPAPDWDRYKGALQFDSYQLESPSVSSARLFDGIFLHLMVFRNDNEDAGWTGVTGYVQFSLFWVSKCKVDLHISESGHDTVRQGSGLKSSWLSVSEADGDSQMSVWLLVLLHLDKRITMWKIVTFSLKEQNTNC